MPVLDRLAQRLARREQVLLADELVERARTHARRERLRAVSSRREQRRAAGPASRAPAIGHAQPPARIRAAKYTPQPARKPAAVRQPPRALELRHEVRRADVQRDARRERQAVIAQRGDVPREQRRPRSSPRRAPPRASSARRAALPGGEEQARDRQPFGQLVQQHARRRPARRPRHRREPLATATPSTNVCSSRPTSAPRSPRAETSCVSSPKWKCVPIVCCVRCTTR